MRRKETTVNLIQSIGFSEGEHNSFLYLNVCLKLKQELKNLQFSSVQSLSLVRLFATPWIAARQASLSTTNSQSLLKLMSIESDAIQSSHPLSSPSPPSPNPSQHQGLF